MNARLQEYYAEVEKEDMSNLVDMPCKEKIRNVDDIPETCNEHLGCSQRQVTHQSSPNESVGEEPSVTDHEREPVRDYDSEQHNEVNKLDSEPDSDYYFDDNDSLRIETDEEDFVEEETIVLGNQQNESEIREPTVEELQDCAIRLLREWVVESGVAHMHSTRLLHILKDFAGMTFLPRTTKKLLGSIRGKLNFKEIPPGLYYHSGAEAGLLKVMLAFKEMGIPIPNVVQIIFNVDGSSTSKSGYGEFWPILCRIVGGITCL
ncbi:hypothetical protein OUZ56_007194 [Daphnia magna]|uniref:Uncharacterized protein n=1 Tax=Daphnia magna TaxID=35525 RepID=A0ABQ9YZ47_9CRUS|nr:hypothetical protein OUZ56_007194 [Daphnia magna]